MGLATKEEALQRQRYDSRLNALKSERSSWDAHWRELGDYMLPRRLRFNSTERNNGRKLNEKIINNTPIIASRVLSAGMMAGVTSPSRPWFRLTTADAQLAQAAQVKSWLHMVELLIREALAKSNIYSVLAGLYGDLGVPGTAAALLEADEEDGMRAELYTPGTYYLANSARQRVDTFYREVMLTVAQMVEKFTFEKCSKPVQDAYKRGGGALEQVHEVIHLIEPNRDVKNHRKDYQGKAFISCWYEKASDAYAGFLRVAGYKRFPILAVRWDLASGDVYGRSPAMDSLGDAKALQLLEKRKAQLIDKLANPPMKGPASLRNQRVSLIAGDFTPVDETAGGGRLEPAMVVDSRGLPAVEESIRQHEQRINSAMYSDLWLMMAQSDRRQITAREIDERHEEKMLQLGPVLDRLSDELLDPLIDWTFDHMLERGELPPPPKELQGVQLKIEFISIMAQAQKAIGTVAVERLASFVGSLAAAKPDVLDKFNADEAVDEYSEMLGTRPDLVNSDEIVKEIRAARAEQAQQALAMEQSVQTAAGAKTLSEADTQNPNGLTNLLGSMGASAGGLAQ